MADVVADKVTIVVETQTENAQSGIQRLTGVLSRFGAMTKTVSKVSGQTFSAMATGAKIAGKAIGAIAGVHFKVLGKAFGALSGKITNLFAMFKKRLMYRAINALISAITNAVKEGTSNLYQYSKMFGGRFSQSMDKASTAMLYFKNSIGAMLGPLVNMLVPILEQVIRKVVEFVNVLNQLFARLSGSSTWTRALWYPKEYAKATDKANKAAKKWKATILSIDELNLMADNSSSPHGASGDDMDYSSMFEEVALADHIKNPFEDFFKPFAEAWANEGMNTIEAIKIAFGKLMSLGETAGETFNAVWGNGTGQRTIETILRIVTNLFELIGNTASAVEKAWVANDSGERQLQAMWNILNSILGLYESIIGFTADWMGSLDLAPLFNSSATFAESLEPNIATITDALKWLYEEVLLPIAKWVAESAIPAFLDSVSASVDAVQALLEPVVSGVKQLWSSIQPLIEFLESVVLVVIGGVKKLFEELAATFVDKGADIEAIFTGLGDIISALWVVAGPALVLFKDLVVDVFTFLGGTIGGVIGSAIEILSGLVNFIAGVLTGDWERAWGGILKIFEGIIDSIKDPTLALVNFFVDIWHTISGDAGDIWGGIKNFFVGIFGDIYNKGVEIWNKIRDFFAPVSNWVKEHIIMPIWNTFEPVITNIKILATGVWEIIKAAWGVASNWFKDHVIDPIKTKFTAAWDIIKQKASDVWEGIKSVFSKVSDFFKDTFEKAWKKVLQVFSPVGEIFVNIKDAVAKVFSSVVNQLIRGINKVVKIPFQGINNMIKKLRDTQILGISPFSGLKELNIPEIPEISLKAKGGMVDAGTMFIAGEAGPEIVAGIGNRSGVMNVAQMEDAVRQGYAEASAAQTSLLEQILNFVMQIEGKDFTAEITTGELRKGLSRANRRDGRVVVPVG